MDMVIVMKNGEVSEVGTYEDLVTNGCDFAEFMQMHLGEKVASSSGESSSSDESDGKYLSKEAKTSLCFCQCIILPIMLNITLIIARTNEKEIPSFCKQLSLPAGDSENDPKNIGGMKNITEQNNNVRKRNKKRSIQEDAKSDGELPVHNAEEDRIAGKLMTDEEEEDVGNVS